MEEEIDFAALYKRLIVNHYTPEPERAEAVLRKVLEGLRVRDSSEILLEKRK